MLKYITVSVAPEIEAAASEQQTSVEAVVNEALATYLQTYQERKLREKLELEYQALANMWHELSDELAADQWLEAENEALENFEKSLEF